MRYRAYLLRLWKAEQGGQTIWRASLESAETGDRIGFPTLDALFEYVRLQARHESSLCSQEEGQGKVEE